MKEFLKDKKKVTIAVVLILLLILGIVLWRRRRKSLGKGSLPEDKEESGYVMPRGFFPGGGLPTAATPITPVSNAGRSIVPSTPTPSPTDQCTNPPCPPTPYPYYPGPVYYNPFPQTYIIEDDVPEQDSSRMSRQEYIDYLRNRITALENAYDKAMSNLRLGKAFRISKEINRVEAILDQYLGI